MLAVLSVWGLVVVLVVIVLAFGTRRIGRAIRAIGAGGRELKRGLRGDDQLPPPGRDE